MSWRVRALLGVVVLAAPLTAGAAQDPEERRTRAGELIVEPPTLTALGFEWRIEGDANRNSNVTMRYRRKGESSWKEGLPLLRLGGEETKYRAFNFVAPHMFAGSLFDLEPDTEYEIALKLVDADGVTGQAEVDVTARTRAEPRPAQRGRVYHVYPPQYSGPKEQPAFTSLLDAYYTGYAHADWSNAFPPRVQPGDEILVHGGLYKDDRRRYGGGMGTVFDGTYYLTAKGTAERPIVIRAAGDGVPIFDGDGNHVLFDVTAADYNYFEGLTLRNTDVAILAGRKRIVGSVGLTVKRSRFEDVGIGITTDWSGSKDFYIADNVFVGRQIPDRLMGWIGRTWQQLPGFPVPLLSNFAIKVYGSGHVIAHNEVSHFHDGIDHATYGDPDGNPEPARDRMPVSIDIYGNDIRNVDDNCIEADGAMHNIRVLRNRCFNHAHRALSAQPLLGGPAYFIRNVVYHAPEGGSVKMQGNPSGVVFYHNTLVGEVHEMGPASNVHFRNNVILGQGAWPEIFSVDTFTNYSSSDYNGFRPNAGVANSFAWLSPSFEKSADYVSDRQVRKFKDLAAYAKATGQDKHSVRVDYGDFERLSMPDPKNPTRFYGAEEFDFRPRAKSRAVDAGVVLPNVNDGFTGRAPDLGAYERGQPLPHYGPRVPVSSSSTATSAVQTAKSEAIYEVLDPRGIWPEIERAPLATRPANLRKKVVHVINSWAEDRSGFKGVIEGLGAQLRQRYPGVDVRVTGRNTLYSDDDPKLWEKVQAEADAFVYVGAPSSSTTAYAFKWSALLERRGIPGAVLLFDTLLSVAESTREREGVPVRYVAVPFPAEKMGPAELEAALDRVADTLTKPLSDEERRKGKVTRAASSGPFFRGTLDEVQEHFHRNGLTDGLPIVPPTRERVSAMLKGTSHRPDEIVTRSMPPEDLIVTVEKVAIIGAMAGCEPAHMPVLLASLEAFQKLNRNAVIRSTASFGFMQVVNGPIRTELGMNAGTWVLGPGNRPNAAIGRALRLYVTNLGGGVPDTNLMGIVGSLAGWPFLFAENEEESPWEPLSVSRGSPPKQSTLTMYFGGTAHSGNYGHVRFTLEHLAEDIAEFENTRGAAVILSPKRAELLAAAGLSKQDVRRYLHDHARKRLGSLRASSHFDATRESSGPQDENESVPVFAPDTIDVVVAGGDASPMMQAWQMGRPVTVSIDAWR